MATELRQLEPQPHAGTKAPTSRRSPQPRGPAHLWKRLALGPALPTEQLEHERLGKPTALAVSRRTTSRRRRTPPKRSCGSSYRSSVSVRSQSSSRSLPLCWSSSLSLILFSYRQTIKAYPTAGGAYMVTRDNFGLLPAQVAGVALLTDYVLTVSVSIAAGSRARLRVPRAHPYASGSRSSSSRSSLGNLRASANRDGVRGPDLLLHREHGRPARVGSGGRIHGDLHAAERTDEVSRDRGSLSAPSPRPPRVRVGGAAVTGVEAISNGVPAFKKPEWKNARTTLVIMGSCSALMFLGLSFLASQVHVAPFERHPTVISQIGKQVFGVERLGTPCSSSLKRARC